ncbi:MAG: DUF5666 domain-containing protein, partial [Pseudomonas sp.]
MTRFLHRFRAAAVIALALVLGLPSWGQAAPACVSRDEVGMSGGAGLQFPGGTGGTGAMPGGVGGT